MTDLDKLVLADSFGFNSRKGHSCLVASSKNKQDWSVKLMEKKKNEKVCFFLPQDSLPRNLLHTKEWFIRKIERSFFSPLFHTM